MPTEIAMIMPACNRLGPLQPPAPFLRQRKVERAPGGGTERRRIMLTEEFRNRTPDAVKCHNIAPGLDIAPGITGRAKGKFA